MKSWYYLHTNGDLINKRFEYCPDGSDFEVSDFCKKYWLLDTEERISAWMFLVEALVYGANKDRVKGLALRWGCNDTDALVFTERLGMVLSISEAGFMAKWVGREGESLKSGSIKPTALEAIADLASLGTRSSRKRGF